MTHFSKNARTLIMTMQEWNRGELSCSRCGGTGTHHAERCPNKPANSPKPTPKDYL